MKDFKARQHKLIWCIVVALPLSFCDLSSQIGKWVFKKNRPVLVSWIIFFGGELEKKIKK